MAKRNVELTMKMTDIEKAQEKAANLAAAAEAVRNQHQAALDSQEEDLTVHEANLAARSVARMRSSRPLSRGGLASWSRGTRRHSMPRLWPMPAK